MVTFSLRALNVGDDTRILGDGDCTNSLWGSREGKVTDHWDDWRIGGGCLLGVYRENLGLSADLDSGQVQCSYRHSSDMLLTKRTGCYCQI